MKKHLLFPRKYLVIIIALSIGLSAFGAHGLKSILVADQLESFKTATSYLLIQTALVLILSQLWKESLTTWIGLNLVQVGVLLFSVSIYVLLLFKNMDYSYMFLVPITPIGGSLMILGWILVATNLKNN